MDNEPEPQPPEEALFAGEEALHGRPPKIAPAEGIRLMRDRLEQLNHELTPEVVDGDIEYLKEITQKIRDTKQRLAEYEAQLKGQN